MGIDNILISNKISSREENYKYFIGYIDGGYKTKSYNVICPNMSAYIKGYDIESQRMSFLTELLKIIKLLKWSRITKKYDIWDKVSNNTEKEFDEIDFLLYNEEFLKNKIKLTLMKLQIFTMKECLD